MLIPLFVEATEHRILSLPPDVVGRIWHGTQPPPPHTHTWGGFYCERSWAKTSRLTVGFQPGGMQMGRRVTVRRGWPHLFSDRLSSPPRRADAVNAAACAREHVIRPLDDIVLSQDCSEDLKLSVTELGAGGGRCANGAVVLNQEE